jgi:hypothetical protein
MFFELPCLFVDKEIYSFFLLFTKKEYIEKYLPSVSVTTIGARMSGLKST